MAKSLMKPASLASTPSKGNANPVQDGPRPIHTIHYGDVRGRIWECQRKEGTAFTLTIDRCIRDKAGNEQLSLTFLQSDVRHLAKVTAECCKWIEWQVRRLAEPR